MNIGCYSPIPSIANYDRLFPSVDIPGVGALQDGGMTAPYTVEELEEVAPGSR